MKSILNSLSILLSMAFLPAHAAYNMQAYYPLSEGNSWTYFEVATEKGSAEVWTNTYTEMVFGTDTVNGIATARLVEQELEPQDEDYLNLVWGEEGLKLYYQYDTNLPCCEETETVIWENHYKTPATLIPANMEMGTPITDTFAVELYEGEQLVGYEEATMTTTVKGVETITVEAGTFKDCLKIHRQTTLTDYDKQGGTVQGSWRNDLYFWLAKGVGKVKEIGNPTEPDQWTTELRWAQVDNMRYGKGLQVWNGADLSQVWAWFEESTMYLNGVVIDGDIHNEFAFRLDLDNLFYAYEPDGYDPLLFPNLDFTSAYVRMNGDRLFIYGVGVEGFKYWTVWQLVVAPQFGFSLVDFGG